VCRAGDYGKHGNVRRDKGCGALHLGNMLSGQSVPAMSPFPAVAPYDDLPACAAGIPMGTTNDESAARIDVEFDIPGEKLLNPLRHQIFHPRQQNGPDVLFDLFKRTREIIVLRGKYNGIDPDWFVFIAVFNRYLR